jgi:mRNA interferase MazF
VEVKRGSVVIVAHGDFGRPRPAVVVQADELGEVTTTLLVCPLTSGLTEKLPIRPTVEPQPENGLRVQSQIMTDKMLALPRDHVRQTIGTIDSETRARLDAALLLVLGLAR